MKLIDTGLTSSLWGLNPVGRPMIYLNNSWVPVSGVGKDISADEAGVWAVKGDGKVLYRAGISHLNPTGMRWKIVDGYFKQVDSGEEGIVFGIDGNKNLQCRSGIRKDLPTGLLWNKIEGSYKQVTCGYRGCSVITQDNKILFRLGVTADNCQHGSWVTVKVPKKMVYIDTGSDGTLWAVAKDGEVWYREGVDDLHPYGSQWKKLDLDGKFSVITSGLNGQYALDESGYVYHLEGKTCHHVNICFVPVNLFLPSSKTLFDIENCILFFLLVTGTVN